MRILLDKILKSKVGCPPNFFSKLKISILEGNFNLLKVIKFWAFYFIYYQTTQVGDVIKWGFCWTKSWKAKLVVHQNFFQKQKNIYIYIDHGKKCKKKFKKKPCTPSIFSTIFTLKNTLEVSSEKKQMI